MLVKIRYPSAFWLCALASVAVGLGIAAVLWMRKPVGTSAVDLVRSSFDLSSVAAAVPVHSSYWTEGVLAGRPYTRCVAVLEESLEEFVRNKEYMEETNGPILLEPIRSDDRLRPKLDWWRPPVGGKYYQLFITSTRDDSVKGYLYAYFVTNGLAVDVYIDAGIYKSQQSAGRTGPH